MIKLENIEVVGFEHAIRGMRNPLNSWDKSDSGFGCGKNNKNMCETCKSRYKCDSFNYTFNIGGKDLNLAQKLTKAGTDHRKFLRMISVYMNITAPLYWWKEYDTYKVGTVANSCSTMHKIADKEFTLDDFSIDKLNDVGITSLKRTLQDLNHARRFFLSLKDKEHWWQIIQLLPSSYNQKRTVMLNYEVLLNMYHARKNHKLDEWCEFCKEIEKLPYFKEICLDEK